jgi:hypothetical protein
VEISIGKMGKHFAKKFSLLTKYSLSLTGQDVSLATFAIPKRLLMRMKELVNLVFYGIISMY